MEDQSIKIIIHVICVIFNVYLLHKYWGGFTKNFYATIFSAMGPPGTFMLLVALFISKMGWNKYLDINP